MWHVRHDECDHRDQARRGLPPGVAADRDEREPWGGNEELARIFGLDLDLLCITDADGRFRRVSKAWETTLGYSPERLEGTRYLDLVHPDDLQATLAAQEGLDGGSEVAGFVNRYRHRDGSYRWIEWRASSCEGRLVYAAARDITERLGMEEALRVSEVRYRTLFEQIPDGIVVFDKGLIAVDCNDAMATIVGLPRERLIGEPASGTAVPAGVVVKLEAALTGEVSQWGVVPFASADDRERFASGVAAPLHGPDGDIAGAICVVSDQTERKHSEDLIERLAFRDPVTDLPNRTLLRDRLRQAVDQAQRANHMMALAVLDVDRFKLVNDSLGHGAGDRVLQQVAARLDEAKRAKDTVARIGGDEFAVLMPHVRSSRQILALTEKLVAACREPIQVDGTAVHLTLSLGVTVFPADATDATQLLTNADTALRAAKDLGGDAGQSYDLTMNLRARERLQVASELRTAIEEEQLVVHYQPQIDLGDLRAVGVEALVRWQHPERGLISPLEFIPLAEETGLIGPLSGWVMRSACRDAVSSQAWGGRPLRMAVNISARSLHSPGLVLRIRADLEASGLDPERLELEVTETAIMADERAASDTLKALRELGLTIALDDFGTGYSSLSHLHKLPIDRVKIDRSFVSRIEVDGDAAAIVQAVTRLAHAVRLGVVAEGVETQAELDFLQELGCDAAQGYLFARPLPLEECGRVVVADSMAPVRARGVRADR